LSPLSGDGAFGVATPSSEREPSPVEFTADTFVVLCLLVVKAGVGLDKDVAKHGKRIEAVWPILRRY
jgi:hypothetical protein